MALEERIEINQPFRIIIECYLNGVIADLGEFSKLEMIYYSPSGVETKVTASILNAPGTDGKIYYDVPANIFNDARVWEAKPLLTTGDSKELPGEPIQIEIYRKWEETT